MAGRGRTRRLTNAMLEEIREGMDRYFPVHFAEKFGVKPNTIRLYMKKFREGWQIPEEDVI